ncbi:MAG TPA: hypothetical protein VNN09_14915 [Candidatus Competibacteraceae bacterium]|nr:hypothetical protein [Candidatus Competibacteraceae bacterium]
MRPRLLWVSLAALLLVLVATWLLRERLPALSAGASGALALPGSGACDPSRGPCSAGSAAAGITLSLDNPVGPLRPFAVRVGLSGAAATAEAVAVRFDMVGMDMGFNRFVLQRQVDGSWQGQALLPVCSVGRSDWRVTVEAGQEYRAQFLLRLPVRQ